MKTSFRQAFSPASMILSTSLLLGLLSGCNQQPGQGHNNQSADNQSPAPTTAAVQPASQPEQDYGYEGYDESLPVGDTEEYTGNGNGIASEPERIEVSPHRETLPNNWGELNYLVLTALSDEVSISQVTVNRGHCNSSFMDRKDALNLQYGQTTKLYLRGCKGDQVREVSVQTLNDTYTVNF